MADSLLLELEILVLAVCGRLSCFVIRLASRSSGHSCRQLFNK